MRHIKHFVFLILLMGIPGLAPKAYAQLITENESRLKTEVKKRDGLFSGKGKRGTSASGSFAFQNKRISPRYSQPVATVGIQRRYRTSSGGKAQFMFPGSGGSIRYSPGSPFASAKYKVNPRYSGGPLYGKTIRLAEPIRYSSGSPYAARDKKITPRYSKKQSEGVVSLREPIRYSPGSPFSPRDKKVSPRYSKKQSESVVSLREPVRYSSGSPFTARDKKIQPRYSGGPLYGAVIALREPIRYSPAPPYTAKDFRVKPRYSGGPLYGKVIYLKESPRYSPGSPFDKYYTVKPMTSKGSPYDPNDFKVKPRYSITQKHSIKRYWTLKHVQYGSSMMYYKGPYTAKIDRPKNSHPSAAHLNGQFTSYNKMAEGKRKWSILTSRIFRGNNTQPDAVTQKASKPKFDRKEREIWYN